MPYIKEKQTIFTGLHTDDKPTGKSFFEGCSFIEKDTFDRYLYLNGEWVFLDNLRFNVNHAFLWNTESLEWEASTKGSGSGQEVSVENFPAAISGASIPITGEISVGNFPSTQQTEEPKYLRLIDEYSDTVLYVGEAAPGSAENASVWRLIKIDMSSGIRIEYADGDSEFNNTWTEHLSKNYS